MAFGGNEVFIFTRENLQRIQSRQAVLFSSLIDTSKRIVSPLPLLSRRRGRKRELGGCSLAVENFFVEVFPFSFSLLCFVYVFGNSGSAAIGNMGIFSLSRN